MNFVSWRGCAARALRRRAFRVAVASPAGVLLLTWGLLGCERKPVERSDAPNPAPVLDSFVGPTEDGSVLPLGPPSGTPEPRVGMIYIPPGALVVGTPKNQRPRRADRELSGEQVMLEGFYIDRYPYPNEEGAIPVTSVSQAEATALCEKQKKRLCSELEWERACKGPDNRVYEYGQSYDELHCRTGKDAHLRPSGYHVGCQSDFGVRDMHGGPFEWTSSDYGRGAQEDVVSLKGGNAKQGEVVGRCANVEPMRQDERSGTIGFRCCFGEENVIDVELEPSFRAGLIPRAKFAPELEQSLISALPEEASKSLEKGGTIARHRVWLWRPVANEELHLMAICGRGAPPPHGPKCGMLIARVAPGDVQVLAWVSSGKWVADLHRPGPHEYLWLIGGDIRGSFKRLIRYRYGDIKVGDLSRGAPRKK